MSSERLVSYQEGDHISRELLIWANTFPEKPVDVITFEFSDIEPGYESAMLLSNIQSPHILEPYLRNSYKAEYQFKIVYRIKPGVSNDKRLKADELLNQFGDWAATQKPNLGEDIQTIRVEQTTLASKFAAYEDGYEDYQILMKLTYYKRGKRK